MKILLAVLCLTLPLAAQGPPRPAGGGLTSNLGVIRDAQEQVLEQAREALETEEDPRARGAMQTAIDGMERALALLDAAKASPDKLAAAWVAEQEAFQALLKAMPREYQVSRSRSQSGGAGQPTPRELAELDMVDEENRYETERQAAATPNRRQTERLQTADRLKELARRQQDLNDRLRELQTALQQARDEQEREEIRRQLKRLRDEERHLLADTDELRQNLSQSPDATSLAEAGQQLDQARSDLQRAAQDLENEAVSQALAAGKRAQQSMEHLRDELRRQNSSQFAEQMRQLRSQARDLNRREEEIARGLESLSAPDRKKLGDDRELDALRDRMGQQQSALTNLLSGMRSVTEQAESSEPLLSQQLYDALRRADQKRTDDLLETSSRLLERGFVSQASEAEGMARQHVNELMHDVERAAESILGNESEALRFAQRELEDLSRQVQGELAGASTNQSSAGAPGDQDSQARSQAGPAPSPDSDANPGSRGSGQSPGASEQAGNAAQPGSGAQPAGQSGSAGNEPAAGQDPSGEAGGAGRRDSPGRTSPRDRSGGLREFVQQLGGGSDGRQGGLFTGGEYGPWADRLRDVEQALDSPAWRNRLATVRERAAELRSDYRKRGQAPDSEVVRQKILTPMNEVRVWLREELARREDVRSLVPLDRDPVPEHYAELVRRYYEKLGNPQ